MVSVDWASMALVSLGVVSADWTLLGVVSADWTSMGVVSADWTSMGVVSARPLRLDHATRQGPEARSRYCQTKLDFPTTMKSLVP